MNKTVAGLCLITLVAALVLVRPTGIIAQPQRSDLEERVIRLEVEASTNRLNIQSLERQVRDLETSAGGSGRNASDLESSVSWIRHVYIPSSEADIDRLDKRVKELERKSYMDYVCAKPTAKQRKDSNQMALAKQRAALCLDAGGTPE